MAETKVRESQNKRQFLPRKTKQASRMKSQQVSKPKTSNIYSGNFLENQTNVTHTDDEQASFRDNMVLNNAK